MSNNQLSRIPDAIDIDFDPTGSDLVSTNVEDAIKETTSLTQVSASPGFTWGRSGNIPSNTWLLNDTVPSNKAGRTVALAGPEVTNVFVANEDINTFDIEIFEHQGDEVGLTSLGTVNIVSARSADFVVSFPATKGRQIAIKLSSGSAKNCVVGLQLKGSIV